MSESNEDGTGNSEKQLLHHRLIADLCQETITKLQIFQRGLRLNAPIIATAASATTTTRKQKAQGNPLAHARRQKKVSSKGKSWKKPQHSNDDAAAGVDNVESDDEDDKQQMPDERVLNAIKMDKELDTLVEVFSEAANEVLNTKPNADSNGKTLKELIAALQANDNEVDTKTKELRQKHTRLQFLKTEIETNHKEAVKRIGDMDERIANLRHNLCNVRRLNDLEFDLVKRWEANRFTQANIVCENKERALRGEIENLDRQITGETRIIAEVEKFNARQFEEYRAKINEWKTKYANEMAKVTAETMEHEKRIMELVKLHERHEQTFMERVEFVREYLEKKAEEQRLYAEQMKRVECAVKLQAWWRGVMVRRGLGPYKKKTKKGKKVKGKPK